MFKNNGLVRELNSGPLAPEARIMPLDQQASCYSILNYYFLMEMFPWKYVWKERSCRGIVLAITRPLRENNIIRPTNHLLQFCNPLFVDGNVRIYNGLVWTREIMPLDQQASCYSILNYYFLMEMFPWKYVWKERSCRGIVLAIFAPCVRIISLDQQTIYYSSATHYFWWKCQHENRI